MTTWSTPRIWRSPVARVWSLTAALTAAGCGLFLVAVLPLDAVPAAPVTVPFVALVALFAIAEALPVHLQFRRNAYTHTLTEVPLLLGLAFVEPAMLVVAFVAGTGAALIIHRRQAPMKLGFNLSKFFFEGGAAVIVYHALLNGASPVSVQGWAAGLAAVVTAWALTTLLITTVVALREGRIEPGMLRWLPWVSLVAMAANASLGLLAVTIAWYQAPALWLVAAVTFLLLVAYRAYGSWRRRHEGLERLHALTHDAEPLPVPQAARRLLLQAADLLRSERAEVVLIGDDEPTMRVHLDGDGRVREVHDATVAALPGDDGRLHAPRRARDPKVRDWLKEQGYNDAIAVPLRGKEGTLGRLLVADRVGDIATFGHEDVKLLETFANHASVSIENSRLVQRLWQEVAVRKHEALHDSLTNLPNRSLFHQRVAEAVESRKVGERLAVLLIDLDHFKEVNDTLGHHVGDRLLIQLAAAIEGALEPDEFAARLGGDEFAVLLSGIDDPADAAAAAERMRAVLAQPREVDALRLELAGSIGIALCPEDGEDSSTLLKRADVAMYLAKDRHTGIEFYRPDRDHHSPRRLMLAGRLREAIEDSHLLVHYQPKAELETGSIVGVEALARWHHPDHGFISPDEFIPMAEQAGLIRPLTRFVLRTVLSQWQEWKTVGQELEIAVNLSPWNLLDGQLPDDLRALLGEYEVPAEALRLEITETGMMTDPHRTSRILQEASALGIGLSIDDFGTGYSSLSWLKRLPVDEVKIDKSFVQGMADGDESDAAIVRSTIDLGRHLGLTVIAEGVEDRATWDRLRSLRCHAAQGYLLSRPVTPENYQRWAHVYQEQRPLRRKPTKKPGTSTLHIA